MKFDIKKKLSSRSERVKCVEIHPELPWVLSSLYSGNLTIYDYSNQTTVKSFEVSSSPVRAAKFVQRKQWIVSCSDDLQVRVYNYNTMEKIKQFEAHSDYIRCIVVHPSLPYILSSSDDGTIKVWDFSTNAFSLYKTYDDHVHYVMQIALNPRDQYTFATASLDKTIKVWNLQSTGKGANYTLTGHQSGINCLDYYKGDKPYLISGGDDRLIKIWDYQTKLCIHTLEGHINNISAVAFHPEIPIIFSTSEDGTLKIWHSNTYKLESNLAYNMERAWSLDIGKDNNIIAIGYDEGTVVIKIGSDEPVVSMNNGKVVFAKNMDISTVNLKAINTNDEQQLKDGENISVQVKELGTSDLYPVALRHSPNGHVFAIFNDSEYSIYRSQTFKNQGFGTGTEFVWSSQGDYAVKDSYIIKIFKGNNNQQVSQIKTDYTVEELHGGPLLGVKSQDFIVFYDWDTCKLVRRIDIIPKKVYWNDNASKVAIVTSEDYYILQFNGSLLKEILESQQETNEDGIEEAFELKYDIHDSLTSGIWLNDVFMYTNQSGKLNYSISGKVFTYNHTDKKKFIIGYIAQQNRLYLIDKQFDICSFEVPQIVVDYQSSIVNGDIDKANSLQNQIPEKYLDKIAKFLDSLDMKQLAYQLVKDTDFKFELAIQLGKLEEAFELAQLDNNQVKYKQIGDLALLNGRIDIAIVSFQQADDLKSQLLIFTSLGLKNQLEEVAKKAEEQTKYNIAFSAYFHIANLDKCIDVLVKSNRIPEAALFAKTYCPQKVSELTKLWKASLQKNHPITAQKIADPLDYQEHFSDLLIAEQISKHIQNQRINQYVPAHHYQEYNELLSRDLFKVIKEDPSYKLIPQNIKINEENECIKQVHLREFDDEEQQGEFEDAEDNQEIEDHNVENVE